MDVRKIKIEIGSHKIEAEGLSKEESDERLSLFKELVLASLGRAPQVATNHAPDRKREKTDPNPSEAPIKTDDPLAPLFRAQDRVVSLTNPPQGQNRAGDGFLLILLGQRILRNREWVSVSDLKNGLTNSGIPVDRIDAITATLSTEDYMKRGERRHKDYRLTNPGEQKAKQIGEEILKKIS
jgi:hypothetical protein